MRLYQSDEEFRFDTIHFKVTIDFLKFLYTEMATENKNEILSEIYKREMKKRNGERKTEYCITQKRQTLNKSKECKYYYYYTYISKGQKN